MKTEDSVHQSLNELGNLPSISGSDYGSKGKRIAVLSNPGVPLVGLMLLATLPFGASIKQSVPRVKLSHRGKSYNIVDVYLYLLWFKKKVLVIWGNFGHFISCQQPSSSVHLHIGLTLKATYNIFVILATSKLVYVSITFCLCFSLFLVFFFTQPRQKVTREISRHSCIVKVTVSHCRVRDLRLTYYSISPLPNLLFFSCILYIYINLF